ncbi:MAG: hypothetical protein NC517_13185 [Firmicutes bacterium]|nr:hypothetical protein [Bacillota bacterium]
MEQDTEYRKQQLSGYKQEVLPLLKYIPWFESNAGQPGSTFYQGPDATEHSMSIPVYDANLLNFVKEASKSSLMDRNYCYTYTRGRIRTHEDERRVIAGAELKDWDVLRGILSKYVMGGMTKSVLWAQAVQENIFLLVLKKMQEIIEFWDRPFDIR